MRTFARASPISAASATRARQVIITRAGGASELVSSALTERHQVRPTSSSGLLSLSPARRRAIVSLPPSLHPSKRRSLTPHETTQHNTTTCSQLMREMNTLLRTDYAWDPAWIDGVTAAIRFKRLDTSVAQTKAAIDYLVSKSIPVHRVENMVSINKQILARTVAELKETVEFIEGKGLQGDELARFLETNPVILRWVLTLLALRVSELSYLTRAPRERTQSLSLAPHSRFALCATFVRSPDTGRVPTVPLHFGRADRWTRGARPRYGSSSAAAPPDTHSRYALRSFAQVVKDTRGVLQCTYYREGVVLGESPVSMIIR